MLWNYNSEGFDNICNSWNIAIITLLRLPFNTHTRYLGPLIGQQHIRTQLYVKRFFCEMHIDLVILLLRHV